MKRIFRQRYNTFFYNNFLYNLLLICGSLYRVSHLPFSLYRKHTFLQTHRYIFLSLFRFLLCRRSIISLHKYCHCCRRNNSKHHKSFQKLYFIKFSFSNTFFFSHNNLHFCTHFVHSAKPYFSNSSPFPNRAADTIALYPLPCHNHMIFNYCSIL